MRSASLSPKRLRPTRQVPTRFVGVVSYVPARTISSVFLTSRRKIREVEVEVLSWRDAGSDTPLEVEPSTNGDARTAARPKRKRRTGRTDQPQTAPEAAAPIPAAPRIEAAPEAPAPMALVEAQKPLEAGETAAAPAQPAAELTCQILFWRGYVKSGFYARVFSQDGEPLSIHESPYFRSKGNGIPEPTGEALAAHVELCRHLERDGWRLVGTGQAWFEQSFRQSVTDVEELERA
jgi:hypothetical protein